VVYHQTSIHSEKFRIYKNEDRKENKKSENSGEILKGENRIIKQAVNAEIDYRNLSVIEKSILTELAGYSKHTLDSLIDQLKNSFRKADIMETVHDMEVKGWLT